MGSTEMVHLGPPLALPPSNTPPDSPSSSPLVTLDDEQAREMASAIAAMKMPPTTPYSHHCSCQPPSAIQTSPLVEILVIAQQFLEAFKSLSTLQGPPPPLPEADGVKPEDPARAPKLEFKAVNEVWDADAYKYKIVELVTPTYEADELDQYVFVVRGRIDKETTETTYYVDIKSEVLRDALRNVLKDAHAVSTKENKLSVEQNLLYHYIPELESCRSWNGIDVLDQNSAKHVGLLVDYLREKYADTTQNLNLLLKNGEITYDLLWALFKPNEPVFTTCHGTHKPRCVKFDFGEEKTTKSGFKYWKLECRYRDFDGKQYGNVSIELGIPKFRGAKRIDLLEAFPLQHHSESTKIKARLIEDGQKFVSLIGSQYRQYNGLAFYMDDGLPVEFNVDGRVMIDAEFFHKIKPNYSRLKITEPADSITEIDLYYDCVDISLLCDPAFDNDQGGREESGQVTSCSIKPAEMTEDDFLICCPTVLGFSFADKQWAEFAVADIDKIQWSSDPFDCLVIKDEDREVIMALVEARNGQADRESDFSFDDFIAGKGRGLNILLHGNPGLGKTLTAEAAAEHLKRPLYSISAGELSTNAAKLESQLGQIFQIAKHWGAVLLLDEADVYLERRSNQDLVRNSLVAVFLRKLEYCEGIMFLTTNRVSQFDEAILSRIHITLRYDDLDKDTKEQIWRQFLARASTRQGPADVSRSELKGLVASKFNGRQIKNIVATAHALATKQESRIRLKHLQRAVAINEKFVREFYGKDYADSVYN